MPWLTLATDVVSSCQRPAVLQVAAPVRSEAVAVPAPAARLRATVRVTNTGPRAGREAVLWCLTDEVGFVARPVRQLRHFEKVAFAPGQSRELTFDILPGEHLSYPDDAGRRQVEDGYFTLRVGGQRARFRYATAAGKLN